MLKARISRLERSVSRTKDAERLSRSFRYHYNLQSVSDEALCLNILSIMGLIDFPEWAKAEFDRPVPANSPKNLVKMAWEKAIEDISADPNSIEQQPTNPEQAISESISVLKCLKRKGENLHPATVAFLNSL